MKKALIIGINYQGTGNDLRGCINDANNIKELLTNQFAFDHIELLLEKDATTQGIKDAIGRLVAGAKSGDVLFLHYSGHGSRMPSTLQPGTWEEIIVPYDINWRDKIVTDKYFKSVFSKLPRGVNLTLFFDCCHSGDMLDQEQSTFTATREAGIDYLANINFQAEGSRFLPPPPDIQHDIDTRQMRVYEYSASRDVNAGAMLVATCSPLQTAADALIDGIFQGAGTFSILKFIRENPSISYIDLITKMNQFMVERKYTQRPQLDGAFSLHQLPVLQPWPFVPVTNDVSTPVSGNDNPQDEKKWYKKIKPEVAIGVIGLIVVLLFAIF